METGCSVFVNLVSSSTIPANLSIPTWIGTEQIETLLDESSSGSESDGSSELSDMSEHEIVGSEADSSGEETYYRERRRYRSRHRK